MAAAGPFADRRDETLRGLCVYVTDIEETRRLAAQDPLALAGRLAPEIVTWLVPPGEVSLTRV